MMDINEFPNATADSNELNITNDSIISHGSVSSAELFNYVIILSNQLRSVKKLFYWAPYLAWPRVKSIEIGLNHFLFYSF